MITSNSLILLSGGLDSTVMLASLAYYRKGKGKIVALNLNYGQLHKKEIECAQYQAAAYDAEYVYDDISHIYKGFVNPLFGNAEMPEGSYDDQIQKNGRGNPLTTYVPFRNGLMLSLATVYAMKTGCNYVYYAAHRDDSGRGAYPDCSPDFFNNMKKAIEHGTGQQITTHAPFLNYTKADIVKKGIEYGVNFSHTWSCYQGNQEPCGRCGTCIDREKAFIANGVKPQ